MSFLKRKEDDDFAYDTNDLLIVFDHDKKTSDINRVTAIVDNAVIVAGLYKVPIEDCEITTGKEGRNFFYRAPSQSITETQRLAELEINTVLKQITSYRDPIMPNAMDWTKGLLFGILGIAVILLGVS